MKRLGYVDIYKSIGIILMIMGHIGFGERFDFFIHAFHMPIFFFISGFLYKDCRSVSFKKYFVKKFRSLIIPYISFGIIHFTISVFLYGYNIEYLKHLLFINTDGLPIAGALWFLTALFFVDIIYYLIDKFIKKDLYQFIIILFMFTCTLYIKDKFSIVLPYAIGSSMAGLILFFIGNKLKGKILNIKFLLLMVITVLDVYLIFNNGYVNMRTEVYSNVILFFFNSILSSIVLINYALIVEKVLKISFISKFIQSIGKNSIVYVCLNQIVILLVTKFINYYLPFKNYFILLLSVILLGVGSYIISKTKLKFLIGK